MDLLKLSAVIESVDRAWSIEADEDQELERIGKAIGAFADFIEGQDDHAPETYLYNVLLDEMIEVEQALLLGNALR